MLKWTLFLFLALIQGLEGLILNDLSYLGQFTPGEKREIKISLRNDKNIPELIEFKQADYRTSSNGETHFLPPGQEARSNADWISLNEHRMKLDPNGSTDLYVTIQVPANPNLSGSYFSVLLVEPTDFIQSLEDVKSGIQLNVKVRFAYHIVTNVGEGVAKLKVQDKQLITLSDKKLFAIDVDNLGTHFLNPKLTLKLYSKQGKLEKTLEAQPERLYPGNSQRFLVDGENLEGKSYKAFLVLDNGDKHLFGDTLDLEL